MSSSGAPAPGGRPAAAAGADARAGEGPAVGMTSGAAAAAPSASTDTCHSLILRAGAGSPRPARRALHAVRFVADAFIMLERSAVVLPWRGGSAVCDTVLAPRARPAVWWRPSVPGPRRAGRW